MSDTPNPGSLEAIEAGCICPRIDNGHGKGYMGGMKDENGNVMFVIMDDCPLHNPQDQPKMTDAERLTFILDIMAQIKQCAANGMSADADERWQYLDEINSNAAYALRKAGEKDNGKPR